MSECDGKGQKEDCPKHARALLRAALRHISLIDLVGFCSLFYYASPYFFCYVALYTLFHIFVSFFFFSGYLYVGLPPLLLVFALWSRAATGFSKISLLCENSINHHIDCLRSLSILHVRIIYYPDEAKNISAAYSRTRRSTKKISKNANIFPLIQILIPILRPRIDLDYQGTSNRRIIL